MALGLNWFFNDKILKKPDFDKEFFTSMRFDKEALLEISEDYNQQIKGNIKYEDFEKIKYLTLNNFGLKDFNVISALTNLDEIHLGQNEIKDISFIYSQKNLKKVTLFANKITDLSPLRNQTYLEELNLNSNPISDLTPIKGLKSLKKLSLGNCSISDISCLENLENLQELRIGFNNIGSLTIFVIKQQQLKFLVSYAEN